MVIYYGASGGFWMASANPQKLNGKVDDMYSCEVSTINNNKLYMIITYYGYYYDYMTKTSTYVTSNSELFHSVRSAQKSPEWSSMENNPYTHKISPVEIASDDMGNPFESGSVLLGKRRIKIIGVKVF